MKQDLEKDVATSHGREAGFHPFDDMPQGSTAQGVESRRPPTWSLEASTAWQENQTSQHGAEAYRARIKALLGATDSRSINLEDEDLESLIGYASSLGFSEADTTAILIVSVRFGWVGLDTLKTIAQSIAAKSKENSIHFQAGWDFMTAYRFGQERLLKGSHLAPHEYLEMDFISSHLAEFTEEASYLLTGKQYAAFVKSPLIPRLGRADGLFLSSKAEIDRILAHAQGDISVIEEQLGFAKGSMTDKEGIYRIDILHPENYHLRIPSGEEEAANAFWHPGGFTSGGTKEAVIDSVPKVIDENFRVGVVIPPSSTN